MPFDPSAFNKGYRASWNPLTLNKQYNALQQGKDVAAAVQKPQPKPAAKPVTPPAKFVPAVKDVGSFMNLEEKF